MRILRSLSVGLLLAIGLSGITTPGAADGLASGEAWVATPNGLIGVEQTVLVHAPGYGGQLATVRFANAAAGINAGQAMINATGFAYLPWSPDLPGVWTLSAVVGSAPAGSTSIIVVAAPTQTTLLAPGTVQDRRTTDLIVEVEALGAGITPSGTVDVRDSQGDVVATGALVPSGDPSSGVAILSWVPIPGQIPLSAVYVPSSAAFAASTSGRQTPVIGAQPVVSLRLPPVSYVGVPQVNTAIIGSDYRSPLGGSVAFNVNIDGFTFYPMGGSKAIGNGTGETGWTPTQPGVQTVGVEYASANFGFNGKASQSINVQPAPSADVITVTPTGAAPWGPGNVGTLQQGTTVELTPSSQSGNPVTLATDGPCALNAGTVTMLGPGTCSMTASSVGNGGSLAPAQQTYTVAIQAAPRKRR